MKRVFFWVVVSCLSPWMVCADEPPCFATWGSYTYFYLDDGRPDGTGISHGQNAVGTVNYFLSLRTTLGAYGIYQRAETKNPPVEDLVLGDRQTLSSAEGWGVGFNISHLFPIGITTYLDYSCVWIQQNMQVNSTNVSYDETNGHRWQITGGLNLLFPIECFVALAGNINYLYIFSHTAGFVDAFSQEVTGQDSQIGIGNANGAIYLRPCCTLNPFINGGISYDLHRRVDPSIIVIEDAVIESEVALRNRLEWNVGAGVLLTKNSYSLAASYIHRHRKGPIKTDSMTFYLSKTF